MQCLKSQTFSNSYAQNRHDLLAKIVKHIDGTSGAERGCNTDWTLALHLIYLILIIFNTVPDSSKLTVTVRRSAEHEKSHSHYAGCAKLALMGKQGRQNREQRGKGFWLSQFMVLIKRLFNADSMVQCTTHWCVFQISRRHQQTSLLTPFLKNSDKFRKFYFLALLGEIMGNIPKMALRLGVWENFSFEILT